MQVNLQHAHPWDVSPSEAVALQHELAPRVREAPLPAAPETVAAVDVSIRGDRARAAVVVVRTADLSVVDQSLLEMEVPFPYVPGLLSFREVPAILPALERLSVEPDVYMADGQGRAHPRRLGLACHLGVLLDRPAFGVAKSRLTGTYEEPGPAKGATSALVHRGEVVGRVVRTRTNVKPVFVSVGHRMTLDEAMALTLALTTRFKLPEPARMAHRLSKDGRL